MGCQPWMKTNEVKKCCRSAGEMFLTGLLKRNAHADFYPQGLVLRLEALFCAKYGGPSRNQTEPFRTFFTENLLQSLDPNQLDEPPPVCPLAIVDFSRMGLKEWTEAEILVLLKYIMELPQNPTFVIAGDMLPWHVGGKFVDGGQTPIFGTSCQHTCGVRELQPQGRPLIRRHGLIDGNNIAGLFHWSNNRRRD